MHRLTGSDQSLADYEKDAPLFGTYHYATAEDSVKTRQTVLPLFRNTFGTLPFPREDELKALDLGCGLGFLSCLCAEYYPSAIVTGVDTFEHESLKDSDLAKARENARALGFEKRVTFRKGDIFSSDF